MPEHGDTVFDTIRMADKAMYLAKSNGGAGIQSVSSKFMRIYVSPLVSTIIPDAGYISFTANRIGIFPGVRDHKAEVNRYEDYSSRRLR